MIPTFLYIKRHTVTDKLYLGKTIRDPLKYNGSGLHWSPHIKIHGKENVETLWYCLFTEQEELTRFALLISEQQDIVRSDTWLNMKPENGIDGGNMKGVGKGRIVSAETRAKMSLAKRNMSLETRGRISAAGKGKIKSPEHQAKITTAMKGRVISAEWRAKISSAKKKSNQEINNFDLFKE